MSDGQRAMEITHLDDRRRGDLAAGYRKGLLFLGRDGRAKELAGMQVQSGLEGKNPTYGLV